MLYSCPKTEASISIPEEYLDVISLKLSKVPYFFGYKMKFFSFRNTPENLDLSYKMDQELLDYLGRVKFVL